MKDDGFLIHPFLVFIIQTKWKDIKKIRNENQEQETVITVYNRKILKQKKHKRIKENNPCEKTLKGKAYSIFMFKPFFVFKLSAPSCSYHLVWLCFSLILPVKRRMEQSWSPCLLRRNEKVGLGKIFVKRSAKFVAETYLVTKVPLATFSWTKW